MSWRGEENIENSGLRCLMQNQMNTAKNVFKILQDLTNYLESGPEKLSVKMFRERSFWTFSTDNLLMYDLLLTFKPTHPPQMTAVAWLY